MEKRGKKLALVAILIALWMALPGSAILGGGALAGNSEIVASNGFVLGSLTPYEKSYDPSVINNDNFIGYTNQSEKIGIVIGFQWRNNEQLKAFLKEVNDPNSPEYRHFMTWEDLKDKYAPNEYVYNATVEWLKNSGIHIEHTWPLRNAISIVDTVGNIERVFQTKFGDFKGDGSTRDVYYAALEPLKLPSNLIPYLNGISGTNNAAKPVMHYYTSSSTDYMTGADIAKMDRVFELYNDTSDGSASSKHIFATGLTVATVLWEGSSGGLFGGGEAAPYDPSAVNYYFHHVIPTWIQNLGVMSHVWGHGTESDCVSPGSGTDGSVSVENELDLEMVGTLAPGVDVVCVYSDSSQKNFPADNYNYILNTLTHNTTLVAVSNSWGYNSETAVDATTMADVEALNALGVTVLAASGDSGKNTPSTPATAAYDDYGFLAIGGTTPTPNGVDDTTIEDYATMAYNTNTQNPRSDEVVWYNGGGLSSSGSQCGVSGIYPEPWWQNVTIGAGKGGRVTADISSMGDRTMIYISDGSGSNSWNTGYSGTSFACPIVAGIFAEMAAYAGRYFDGEGASTGQTSIYGFGFFAPTIYLLANDYNVTNPPNHPFFDVVSGSVSGASAHTGYDEPTGWGVPNAWELLHDIGFKMASQESEQSVEQTKSTYYDIDIWFPYNWTSEVGHFQVSGLPPHTSFSTDSSYVHPAGSGDKSTVRFTIQTSKYTPTGTYTLTISAYTYNHTSGKWGNLTNSVNVTLTVYPEPVHFHSGWNLISISWLRNPTDINTALSGVSWDRAMVYLNNTWHTYDIHRDAKYNRGFPLIDNTMGIWVHATSDGDLHSQMPDFTTTTIYLHKGWNLIGYPSGTVRTAQEIMSGFTGSYDYIQAYNSSVDNIVDIGQSDEMEMTYGYWIHVTSPGTLTIDW